VPKLSGVNLIHRGLHAELTFNLSGHGSVRVVLKLEHTGHLSHSRCFAGRLRHHRACTSYVTVFATTRAGLSAGQVTIPVPTRIHGRRLPRGSYLLTVTPESPAGQPGGSVALGLKLVAV
jgi:hypothetical protein